MFRIVCAQVNPLQVSKFGSVGQVHVNRASFKGKKVQKRKKKNGTYQDHEWLSKKNNSVHSTRYFPINSEILTLSCLPIYPMPSLKVFYQNMDYYNELNIYQKVLNEFRPNFAETW